MSVNGTGPCKCDRAASDEPAEQLVAEQPAAGRQHDPVGRVDRQELGSEGPAEGVGEGRLDRRGRWQATTRPESEDDFLISQEIFFSHGSHPSEDAFCEALTAAIG